MVGLEGLAAVQVGDGPGHPEDAVIAPGGEAHVLVGPLHKGLALPVQGAVLPQLGLAHGGVAQGPLRAVALGLDGPGLGHPGSDGGRGLPGAAVGQSLKLQGGDLGEEVDPVQQGAGELAQILLHLLGGAPAPAGGVAVPPALAGVHGAQEEEPAGVGLGGRRADHGDHPVLHGLAEDLDDVLVKLRQLVQEQHPRLTVVFNTRVQMSVLGV